MIKFYNSLTKQLEEFKPLNENEVKMYVCGSTVYNDMHIGNSRPVICFDTMARFFQYIGYNVKFVSNFTDIDDKIIKKANDEGVDEEVISERYIKSILETYYELNCLPHYKNPKVTENMNEIIDFVKLLIDKGGAYVVDGDVYFDVTKADDYGSLSGQVIENLLVGSRIEENDKKINPFDFNLWKETHEGKKWDSPWSCGRPGWHTECVVMIDNIFKSKIDIHGGGIDIQFPHHENEIAQATVAYKHKIANFWIHSGRIDLDGEKMSKSLGNVIMAKELVREIGYGAYRLLILNVPYRKLFNFRDELVTQSISDYDKIFGAFLSLTRKLQIDSGITENNVEVKNDELIKVKNDFINALGDDLNTPNAITQIMKVVKLANNTVRQKNIDVTYAMELIKLFKEMLWVLGIDKEVLPLSENDLQLINNWKTARANSDFALADVYRKEIANKGIIF